MSAELFHVIAVIIRRLTEHRPVLALPRYDGHEAEGWIGEIEDIDLTLRFLADKQQQSVRLRKITSTVEFGMPTLPPPVSFEGHT